MSRPIEEPPVPRRRRGVLAVLVALLAVTGVAVGGSLLDSESATFVPTRAPLVGRTSTVCPAPPATSGSRSSLGAVVVRQAPGRAGTLTGTPVRTGKPSLTVTEQGFGRTVPQTSTQRLDGVGAMATASTGQVFTTATSGVQRGLMSAPCQAPGTAHWFVGVGAEDSSLSELVLTNPDDAQAEVDLQFFGSEGEVSVPGSPGILVEARTSRTVSLQALATIPGPLTVSVTATTGRVSAVARDLHSVGLDPAGADWHTSAVAPANRLVIPAVPDADGARQLVVANAGTVRANVQIEVLAQSGSFVPAGAASLEVPAGSTATVDLAAGLLRQYGAVRLGSNVPVTGAVVSSSNRPGASIDLAVQSATPALERTGVVALATGPTDAGSTSGSPPGTGSAAPGSATGGVDSELVLSNDADDPVSVAIEVLSYAGVSLRTDDVLVAGHSTSTRRLDLQTPAYLMATVPDGSSVHGGVVYTQPEGAVAGLATVSLSSPDLGGRAPDVVFDPSVAR